MAQISGAIGSGYIGARSKTDIMEVLLPIWVNKNPTASRLKGRISEVLDWSAAKDYRLNHDSGIWDQIKRALPKAEKTEKHHPSCPYKDIYSTIESIKSSGSDDTTKNAIEFIILTAARTCEVRFAEWSEIDFTSKTRTIPGIKMKSEKEHRIPLSARSIEILEMQIGKDAVLIFPKSEGKVYSDMAFNAVLKRFNYPFVVHGFRSTFRDWCAEQTDYPHDVMEAALAHMIKNKTTRAYFRSDLFEKRIALMNDWSRYCSNPPSPTMQDTLPG